MEVRREEKKYYNISKILRELHVTKVLINKPALREVWFTKLLIQFCFTQLALTAVPGLGRALMTTRRITTTTAATEGTDRSDTRC